MKKIFLMVLILGFVFGCATTKTTKDFSNLKDWTDEELMQMHDRLDPATAVLGFVLAGGVVGAAAVAADATIKSTKQDQRRAIRQELEARGYVYCPEKKQGAVCYSEYHPEWEKK